MTAFVLFLASVALWGFIIFLLATGGHPPAWLVWPLLADLALDFFAVPIYIHRGRNILAAWRVLMVLASVSALLWVARAN